MIAPFNNNQWEVTDCVLIKLIFFERKLFNRIAVCLYVRISVFRCYSSDIIFVFSLKRARQMLCKRTERPLTKNVIMAIGEYIIFIFSKASLFFPLSLLSHNKSAA